MDGMLSTCSSCLCLYWQDYGYVANLHYKFFRWWDQHAVLPMGLVVLVVAICRHHLATEHDAYGDLPPYSS
jgi:hypothetical protein